MRNVPRCAALSAITFIALSFAVPLAAFAQTCQDLTGLPCPASIQTDADGSGIDLDTGWTGQSHDAKAPSMARVTLAVTGCSDGPTHPCGECTLAGPIENNGGAAFDNKRCVGNVAIACVSDSDCGASGPCRFFFGPPLPLSAGGVSVCVTNQITAGVTGTVDIEAGSSQALVRLLSRVHTGPTIDKPCPNCVGGACDSGPRAGQACTINGSSPLFGDVSFDCPPDPGGNIGNLPISLDLQTGAQARTLSAASPNCRAPGFTGLKCFCDTCNSANAEPCSSNADCLDPPGPIGPVCGGRRCQGGANNGSACTLASECPSGACAVPGKATAPNACDDAVCSPNTPPDDDSVDEGACAAGPFDLFCAIETFRGCASDTDCPKAGDSCTNGHLRECFTDNGEIGGDVQAAGIVDPFCGTESNAKLGALFCVPPTSSASVNSVSGLPGLGRVEIPGVSSIDIPQSTGVPTPTPGETATPTPIETASPPPGATPTLTPAPPPSETPVATPTPLSSCGNGARDAGEDCDPPDDSACPGACRLDCACPGACVLPNPMPEVLSIVARAGIDLDTGWSGQSHDLPGVDDGSLTAAHVSNCDTDLGSPTCGQCDLNGPMLFPGGSKNCQCVNLGSRDASSLATCDPEAPSSCTAPETCECFYGPPLPLSSGAVSVCVLNRYTAPFTGTANVADSGPHAGEGGALVRLESSVHNGPTVDQPCPVCQNDATARDGVKSGTCSFGPKSGQPCDAAGTNTFFGTMSFDCPPAHAANIGNLDISFTATTQTTTLATAGVKCTAPGFQAQDCWCDTCATAAAEPCNSNADCPAGAACGGRRCIGGSNNGAPCSQLSECAGGGSCGRPGQATAPNQCDDAVCSPDSSDPSSPNDGVCLAGPFDRFCSIETFRGCTADTDCNPPPTGNCQNCRPNQVCSGDFRACFLDPIVRSGAAGTQTSVVAATFCIPPTSSSAVNSVAGLPGPGGLLQPARIFRGGAQCGDGVLETGETCDPPNDGACPGQCLPDCQCPICGDDAVNQPSEQCDGSDAAACPGACQADCTCSATCGNGAREFGEQCDGGDDAACPGACQADCTCGPFCGDNTVDAGEACDGSGAGGQCPASACQGDCTCGPFCGNNTIDAGEDCDGSATGSCAGNCQADCTCAPFCGNGIREAGELCDGSDAALCPGACAADCTCPAIGELSFVVMPGADLDTGWTGTSHDFGIQAGSTITGEIAACDGQTDTQCTFFADVGSFCSGDPTRSCTENTQCTPPQTCVINTYGAPLPLSSGGVPVCVVNRFAEDVTGTYDTATGATTLHARLNSLVHLAADVSRPCAICDCGKPDPHQCQVGESGTCSDNPLTSCTVEGTGPFGPTSNDCPPNPAANVSGSGLNIVFDPVTTGTASFPSNQACDGPGFQDQRCWCDGQPQPNACNNACDGGANDDQPCASDADCPNAPAGACKPLCRQIAGEEVGEGQCSVNAGPIDQRCAGAGEIGCSQTSPCPPGLGPCVSEVRRCFLDPIVRIGMPSTTTNIFAATFCIPATSSPAVNNTAGLPGPGAIRYPNSVDAKFCGDGVANRSAEECDGSDDANCPGQCLPNCACGGACGNDVREFGEQCDGLDSTACPGLCAAPGGPNECTCPPVCGDGFAGQGEQCDPGGPGGTPPPSDAPCPGQCNPVTCQCPAAVCGNGTIESGEACELPAVGCGALQLCVLCLQCAP